MGGQLIENRHNQLRRALENHTVTHRAPQRHLVTNQMHKTAGTGLPDLGALSSHRRGYPVVVLVRFPQHVRLEAALANSPVRAVLLNQHPLRIAGTWERLRLELACPERENLVLRGHQETQRDEDGAVSENDGG